MQPWVTKNLLCRPGWPHSEILGFTDAGMASHHIHSASYRVQTKDTYQINVAPP